jgi:chemotaxis protein methyltransferase CheR
MRVANDLLLEETEMRLLLRGLRDCYGFDFRDYEPGWVHARIWDCARAEQSQTVSGFQERVLHEPRVLERLLRALAMPRAGLFDDREFYQMFRSAVVPMLRTYPSTQIWHPACSTGADAYSLAIVLEEEGLAGRARIYATDFSETVFTQGRDGVFAPSELLDSEEAYLKSGGKESLQGFYAIEGNRAVMSPELRSNIVFCEHNLATDDVFNEFQVIVARNIFPLFNSWLQGRVHSLFFKSLSRFGVLCLGPRDTLGSAEAEQWYEELSPGMQLFRKVKATA